MNLGMTEILLILAIALLFFGPSRLPGLGKSMGEAIRGFKKGLDGQDEPTAGSKSAEQLKEAQGDPLQTKTREKDKIDG